MMKPVSVFEVYTTKFSHDMFLTENLGKLDVYWKNVLQWIPKIPESTTFVRIFFIYVLFLHFSISTVIIMNIQCKQLRYTWSCLRNLRFYSVFVTFGKISLLILNLCISEYLDKIPPWKKMKEVFSVKLQTENLLFSIR